MKKHLLILFFAAMAAFANAQVVCTPDTQTISGVYPDSATGLPDAIVGIQYNTTVTVVIPYDTVGSLPPIPGTATAKFDSVKIKNWNDHASLGLPPNYTVSCEPPGCVFPGPSTPGTVSKGCLLITGMSVIGDTSTYPLFVDVLAYINVTSPAIGPQQIDDGVDVDYYSIKVKEPSSGIGSNYSNAFSIKQNTPNPFKKTTNITYTNDYTGDVTFTVYNMIGEAVHTQKVYSVQGAQNVVLFNGSNLPSGIYSYSLNNGEKTLSKRMILLEK